MKSPSVSSFRSIRGFSLLELVLVLGALLFMIVTIMVVTKSITVRRDAETEVHRFSALLLGLHEYRPSSTTVGDVKGVDELSAAGVVPEEAIEGGMWVSVRGNPISLRTTGEGWAIDYQDVDRALCNALVVGVIGANPISFSSVTINGQEALGGTNGAIGDLCFASLTNDISWIVSPANSASSPTDSVQDKRWGTHEDM